MIYLVFVLILTYVLAGLCSGFLEKKTWNKGFCSQHNSEWVFVSEDSLGERLYKCSHGCRCYIGGDVELK